MVSAVGLIKTKLQGVAIDFITTESTIKEIVTQLKGEITPESTKVISAKLMSLKQGNKSANDYIKEVETMTATLKRAYLSEGVSASRATTYSTDVAVKAITTSTNNEKLKTVMQSADFKNINEVSTKFLTVTTDQSANKAQLLYFKGRNPQFRGRGNFRGNFRGQSRGNFRGGYNNFRQNYRGQNDQNQSNNNRSGGNYRGGRNGQDRYVRFAENSQSPQLTLGGNQSTSTL